MGNWLGSARMAWSHPYYCLQVPLVSEETEGLLEPMVAQEVLEQQGDRVTRAIRVSAEIREQQVRYIALSLRLSLTKDILVFIF